jgi:predicted AlkP superfamily pyrophosphatase or phosphodiesterase
MAALVLALFVGGVGGASAQDPIVIVLSWDGMRHDYLDRADFPALSRMERDGVRAERLIPVFPSSTFPNHVALATGTYPDRHGIVNNVFRDRERGIYSYSKEADWLEAEPIWCAAERQGVKAATFFWVGSETDWNGRGATLRKTPFDADIGEAEKVDQILTWLDLPESERPRLIMAWWHGADGVGHRAGPQHPEIVEQIAEQDGHLAQLLEGIDARNLWARTTLLIVSDHGMTPVREVIDVRGPLEAAGIEADVFPGAATAQIFLADPEQKAAALQVVSQIPDVDVHADGPPPELRMTHANRNGDLMLITTPPRTFYQVGALQRAGIWVGTTFLDWQTGLHGYHPDLADMHAILLAMGRGVPKGSRIGAVHATDVAPTIAHLLGIEAPAQSEGTRIGEFSAN